MLTRQLAILGLESEVVEDGEEALRAWQGQDFALLLTDCHMPVMDGYALTRALRDAGDSAPIIGVTADTSEEASQQMRDAGMNDMLFKPYSLDAPVSYTHLDVYKRQGSSNWSPPKWYW